MKRRHVGRSEWLRVGSLCDVAVEPIRHEVIRGKSLYTQKKRTAKVLRQR
jgi:hypothetical protein